MTWFLALSLLACSKTGDCDSASCASDDTSATSGGDSGGAAAEGMELIVNNLDQGSLLSAWANGDELIFVGGELSGAGGGYYVRYDGESFCYEEGVADRAFWWIHGASEGAWYAVGEGGLILHEEGGVRSDESVETQATLFGVFDEGDRVWAVGGDASAGTGQIWLRQDGAWSLFHEGEGPFFKVWCDGEGDCLFNGNHVSMAVEGDASTAYTPDPAPDATLLTCRGLSWSDVWCVGGTSSSEVWRWDGAAWSEADVTGLGQPLMGIWPVSADEIWVTGMSAIVGIWDGSAWSVDIPVSIDPFHLVTQFKGEMFFSGGNLATSSGDYYGTIGHYGPPMGTQEVGACP